ncbi:MAG: hypothetical protein AAFQ68_24860 [Bacteroidota bacterium]
MFNYPLVDLAFAQHEKAFCEAVPMMAAYSGSIWSILLKWV